MSSPGRGGGQGDLGLPPLSTLQTAEPRCGAGGAQHASACVTLPGPRRPRLTSDTERGKPPPGTPSPGYGRGPGLVTDERGANRAPGPPRRHLHRAGEPCAGRWVSAARAAEPRCRRCPVFRVPAAEPAVFTVNPSLGSQRLLSTITQRQVSGRGCCRWEIASSSRLFYPPPVPGSGRCSIPSCPPPLDAPTPCQGPAGKAPGMANPPPGPCRARPLGTVPGS